MSLDFSTNKTASKWRRQFLKQVEQSQDHVFIMHWERAHLTGWVTATALFSLNCQNTIPYAHVSPNKAVINMLYTLFLLGNISVVVVLFAFAIFCFSRTFHPKNVIRCVMGMAHLYVCTYHIIMQCIPSQTRILFCTYCHGPSIRVECPLLGRVYMFHLAQNFNSVPQTFQSQAVLGNDF